MEDFLGTVWWSVVCFVGGALLGAPLWAWAKSHMPWNK
jgi:hypothetical protein